jgi:hypothetical protein
MQKIVFAAAAVLLVFTLVGCAATPPQEPATLKAWQGQPSPTPW